MAHVHRPIAQEAAFSSVFMSSISVAETVILGRRRCLGRGRDSPRSGRRDKAAAPRRLETQKS
jgi:hypothetical protein